MRLGSFGGDGLQDPEALSTLRFQLRQLLAVDLPDSGRGDRLFRAHLFDLEARLVLVQMLADQARLVVVGPDERLPAVGVVERL